MAKTRLPYAPEFRRQMAELVRAGRTPEELASEFEPTAQSIRNWVAQSERNAGRGDGGHPPSIGTVLHPEARTRAPGMMKFSAISLRR